MHKEIFLDVSDLEPPDPLTKSVQALEKLQAGEFLCLLHRREPCLFIPLLEEQGFKYLMKNLRNEQTILIAWSDCDQEAEAAAKIKFKEST